MGKEQGGLLALCVYTSVASRTRDVIVPLCWALGRTHIVFCFQFWAPKFRKNIEVLKQFQRREPR